MSPLNQAITAPDRAEALHSDAIARAAKWGPPRRGRRRDSDLKHLWREAADSVRDAIDQLRQSGSRSGIPPAVARLLLENRRLFSSLIRDGADAIYSGRKLPHVKVDSERCLPRAYAVADAYLSAVKSQFEEDDFLAFLDGAQTDQDLEMLEIWALLPMLQLSLLIAAGRCLRDPSDEEDWLPDLIDALLKIRQIDWRRVVERASAVERILREDPLGAYAQMDYESRDLYRRTVAELAKSSLADEAQVAEEAIALSRRAWIRSLPKGRRADRLRHVGYYLIDEGVVALKKRIGYQTPMRRWVRHAVLSSPSAFYLVGVELTTFVTVVCLLSGLSSLTPILAGLLLLLLPATQAAVEFINQITTLIAPPRRLAKLDFSQGIPEQCATLVVVPTLLFNEKQVAESVEALEVRYLANCDSNLHFALLTDLPDRADPRKDDDDLVLLCSRLIRRLNERYGPRGHFFLFHRRQVFNPTEDVWMGWERKRGKLLELNDLLRNRSDSFPIKVGDLSVLPRIQYVITLDSDTQLPKDSAHRLVGAIAHPLNRAIINPVTNTVVSGHGILQPRVGVSVHSTVRSRMAGIYSGQTGFDIYTRAVSDVYQDLFGEGSFTGKGIYEVDTFIQVLAERFPSNALLSHDLIEGAYTRSALVSDIELIDDYPSHFRAYSKRKHRWVRGDWQIIFWLFPKVPDYFGRRVPNPLSLISRWKILDNLRRSLIEIATVCLLLGGWFLLYGGPLYWTVVTAMLLLIPVYSQLVLTLLRTGGSRNKSGFLREAGSMFLTGHGNVFLTVIFLPYQALVMLDAIVRTVIRRTITGKKLLEWETAAQAEAATRKAPVDIYLDLTPWLAVVVWAALSVARPYALVAAIPILVLWFSSKVFSLWLNRPPRHEKNAVAEKDKEFLREVAVRTWAYFREYSGAKENFLIPDNVQEEPAAVAHRISPTNMGLLLNARLTAYDLGLASLEEFVRDTDATLSVMERLPRCSGHFLNWYDTKSLEPLEPLFISTVDSGNLAACLWTLKQGCLELGSSEDLAKLAARAGALVEEMNFRMLYNPERKLLSVGYNVAEKRLETACYDLLASEARMASFIAIAKNDIPQESWFHLGRTHTLSHGQRVLLSWTGTMFEYLLPALWMKVYPNTILENCVRASVACQKRHGRRQRVPWGISEAAYGITDQAGNYQYRAFGLPELALKQGVSGAVVAPYASALALSVDAAASVKNLKRMKHLGWMGEYGFYDAIDFNDPAKPDVVRTWMAHHQGMILLAIGNALTGSPMQRRFHAEPFVKANELIMHEKMPNGVPIESVEAVEFVAPEAVEQALACPSRTG
jgi:cyclic beta-1,2-glucan synthetase